ncbi:MAG: transcription elongation factor subunit Spt4 [Candidatus Micrarchaeia archaeon]
MPEEKACRNCKFIIKNGNICPLCGSTDLTSKWSSYVVVLNADKSVLAHKLNIKINSTFALNVD